jgi:predicted DNA-binding transcriptional regulator AlpA
MEARMPRRAAILTPPVPDDDELLTPVELSAKIKIPVATLSTWRARRQGPRAFRVGGHVRYRRSEVDRWLAECGDTAAAT